MLDGTLFLLDAQEGERGRGLPPHCPEAAEAGGKDMPPFRVSSTQHLPLNGTFTKEPPCTLGRWNNGPQRRARPHLETRASGTSHSKGSEGCRRKEAAKQGTPRQDSVLVSMSPRQSRVFKSRRDRVRARVMQIQGATSKEPVWPREAARGQEPDSPGASILPTP